ncbi:MAG TPA: hypothetical protein VN621_07705 [Arthrobacter sp.]|nr:hypothetical protein [Arthrobacter sp.]
MASPTVPAPVLARPVPVPAPHRVPAAGRWAGAGAACLTLGSLALHVVMLASGGHGLVLGLLLAVMALACTGCAAHAVLRPGCRGSLALAGMSIGMALVHAVLVLGLPGGAGMHGMNDGGAHPSGAGAGAGGAGSMHADLMLAVVGLELAVAWLTGLSMHRVRTASHGKMPS